VGTDLGAGEPAAEVLDLLAGFRKAAVDQVLDRLRLLHAATPLGVLAVSGGAAANRLLRRSLAAWSEAEDVDLRLVALSLSGDNAAMIAHAALLRHRRGEHDDPLAVEAASRLPIDSGHGLRPEVDVDDSAAPLPATEEADDGKVEPTA
jgi:tRNA A37 threonylcarbamoyltransferase TsaD